jgi:hypothetical protein
MQISKPGKIALAVKLTFFPKYVLSSTWNLKDELLFNDSQIIPELVLRTYPLSNDSQIIAELVLPTKNTSHIM